MINRTVRRLMGLGQGLLARGRPLRARHALAGLALAGALLCLSGCASRAPEPRVTPITVLDVPFHPQEDLQCGPAALAEVLNYHGDPVGPEAIAQAIFAPQVGGTLDIDLMLYARKRGFEASIKNATLHEVKGWLDQGLPVVLLVDYGFLVYQQGHFMTVVGYSGQGLIAHTGRRRAALVPYDELDRAWARANHWTLLIRPKATPQAGPGAGTAR